MLLSANNCTSDISNINISEKSKNKHLMDGKFQNISELLLDIYLNTFEKDC